MTAHNCLRWKNRIHHFQTQLSDFIDRQFLCDVTLVAEGQRFEAHQVILAASSSYFKNIFQKTPASQRPIIFLPNVTPQEIQCILDYIYKGETVVPKDSKPGFLKTCELLGISDLCEDSSTPVEDDKDITPSLNDMEQNVFDEDILDSPPHSPESLIFLVASPEKQINSTAEQINSRKEESVIIISQNNSEVIEISDDDYPMEVSDNQASKCDKILSMDTPNQLNQVVSTPVPLQNNTHKDVHQNDNSSPVTQSMSSISDMTQIDLPSEETCVNNNLFNEDILDSPPRSPQSLIFSVANTEKRINSNEDSVITISQNNSQVIEISDDDYPMEVSDNQASKCDKILGMDKLNRLNQQLKVVQPPLPSTDESSAFFVGTVYKSIESVPIGLKRTYCRKCCRCLHPVFWERHIKGHKNQI